VNGQGTQGVVSDLATATTRRLAFELRAEGVIVQPNRWTGGAHIVGPGWEHSAELAKRLQAAGWRCYADADGLRDRFNVLPLERQ
jgi:hypothetical protein